MKRVTFDGCAGWLHGARGNTGVVLCAPHGHEMMWAHRAFRHLADHLAQAGVPVLRFDYRGTGDAADLPGGIDPLAAALDDIAAATTLLRRTSGATRVVLCGLRLGASLAALAATRIDAAGVVMLAPVLDGRLYLRELRALHAGWRNSAIPELDVPPTPAGAQDVLSFRLPATTLAAIQSIRIDATLVLPRTLLLDAWPDPGSPLARLAGDLREAGIDIELDGFAEYPDMMRSAEFADVPAQACRRITGWIGADAANAAPAPVGPVPTPDALAPPALDGVAEHPVWIDNARLFGVLCTPAPRARDARPNTVVIFPNTGGNHHVGDGRLFVEVSRQLARHGFAALRLDVSSLGDAPGAAQRMDLQTIYAETPRRDLAAAVDAMRARGFRCVVLAGICSGAFLSLHAALANRGVNGLMLVNLVKFRWDAADNAAASDHLRPAHVYLAAACKWENWRRLMRGELGLRRLAAAMARRVRQRLRERRETAPAEVAEPSPQTVPAFASAAVREFERRGVRTLFLYGASDVGLHEAHLGLGKRLEALEGLRHVRLQTLPLLDHSLFLTESRDAFAAQLLAHLGQMPQAKAAPVAHKPPATQWRPASPRKSNHGMAAETRGERARASADASKPARGRAR
ncbi:serine aminopeptidase domain-containing protein [Cupriavidus pauculus]|uniref:Alpha/beta hydrolase n=1 Tax=Cupriavidus pauculus TaxID=82633 RepID=A0A3G8H6B9_9BURK|nr:alpha/beta hydrolase [Cupriavidus pauculus]AZG16077.1 alpha/beta hydrolase [Cupriavidus pauculus]